MNPTTDSPPATIRARIHESAVKRVTRAYGGTLADIFSEGLQNSRRAGATHIRISVAAPTAQPSDVAATGETPLTVTIADDGQGIADPAVLLSFGENGWSDELVRREDAAGFGFASLARRNCIVSSRPRPTGGEVLPGWHVSLSPEHFLGDAEAAVHGDEAAPFPHGTSISFEAAESLAAIRGAAEERRPALPVAGRLREPHRRRSPGEEPLPRRAFSTAPSMPSPGAASRSASSGIAIPATTTPTSTSSAHLAGPAAHGGDRSRCDLDRAGRCGDCPGLELVLPARKEAVENALPRRDARGGPPRDLPRPWRPSLAALRLRGLDARERGRHRIGAAAGPAAALAALRGERQRLARPAEARCGRPRRAGHGLRSRAAGGASTLARGRTGRHRITSLRGRPQARRLRLVRRARPGDGHDHPGRRRRQVDGDRGLPAARAAGSAFRGAAGPARGDPHRARRPPAVGTAGHARHSGRSRLRGRGLVMVEDALPLVTVDSALQPHALAELLRAGFFSPSDDADSDSWETQLERFDESALHLADAPAAVGRGGLQDLARRRPSAASRSGSARRTGPSISGSAGPTSA